MSGNHAEIDAWRRRERIRRTKARRPDLIDEAALTDEERRELEATEPRTSSPTPQARKSS
jgi:tRNA (guanine37-N1)-methyltransferase